jgi:uncharacterized damage-inducible protein DinB
VTWTAPDVIRMEPAEADDERTAVQAWLDYHRATLLWKCAGLDGSQLCAQPIGSSTLSLLGLVRHMAEVERWWFRRRFAGLPGVGDLYCSDEYLDGDFDLTEAGRAEADFAAFRAECAAADEAARGRALEETFTFSTRTGTETLNLRWVYLHMIEEYARHNGHADLLRELIDGVTGD